MFATPSNDTDNDDDKDNGNSSEDILRQHCTISAVNNSTDLRAGEKRVERVKARAEAKVY